LQDFRRIKDKFVRGLLFLAGMSVIVLLGGIFAMLFYYGMHAFSEISLSGFFFNDNWNPSAYGEPSFGILSMVVSTLFVSLGAMVIAIPIGVGAAAYISEIARPAVRETLKPVIEILASIPSVVVGFFGIVFLGPLIADLFGLSSGLNAINGSFLLAFMALPTIISVSEDAIHSVPEEYKAASTALGATKWYTLVKVVLPAASSGIIASIMLGFGRAIGETMTVLMATGNALRMPGSFFDSVRTMTANIAIELGEVPFNTTHYYSLFAVGLILFLMTMLVNFAAERITQHIGRHKL
jgi:phosphate transport system permease protein